MMMPPRPSPLSTARTWVVAPCASTKRVLVRTVAVAVVVAATVVVEAATVVVEAADAAGSRCFGRWLASIGCRLFSHAKPAELKPVPYGTGFFVPRAGCAEGPFHRGEGRPPTRAGAGPVQVEAAWPGICTLVARRRCRRIILESLRRGSRGPALFAEL